MVRPSVLAVLLFAFVSGAFAQEADDAEQQAYLGVGVETLAAPTEGRRVSSVEDVRLLEALTSAEG